MRVLMTMGFWHGPWVHNICENAVNVGVCVCVCALFAEKVCLGCLESTAFTRDSCVEARIQWFQWEISNLTNADRAADLVFSQTSSWSWRLPTV